LDAGDCSDLRAKDRRDVDELGHLNLNDDIVRAHDFMELDNSLDIAQRFVHALSRARVRNDEDVGFNGQQKLLDLSLASLVPVLSRAEMPVLSQVEKERLSLEESTLGLKSGQSSKDPTTERFSERGPFV